MLNLTPRAYLKGFIAIFFAVLGAFTLQAEAKIVRFPVFPEPGELERPKVDLSHLPKTVRILNPSYGSYFHSTAIEFEAAADGSLKRSKTYSIDYLRDAMALPPKDMCEMALSRNQQMGQVLVDTMLAGTSHRRIDNQALGEMAARRYLDPGQLDFYKQSAEGAHPDGFIFLESLSWMSAKEVIRAFGKVPWERVAELDIPYDSISQEELRQRAEAADEKIRIRIRRATLRIALGMMFPRNFWMVQRATLPWEEEARKKGKTYQESDDTEFVFEFGRASQIPGLENEALQLGGVAALVAAHYSGILAPPRRYPDLNRQIVYFHALKPTHSLMYRRHLGAEFLPGLDDPNDSVLKVSVQKLIDKTFKASGLFRDFSQNIPPGSQFDPGHFVKANRDASSHVYYAMDWKFDGHDMAPSGPILIHNSPDSNRRIRDIRIQTGTHPEGLRRDAELADTRPPQTVISPAAVFHDNSFPHIPQSLLDSHDMYVSGLNTSFSEADPQYLLKLLLTLKKTFNLDNIKSDSQVLVAGRSRALALQAQELGAKAFEFTGKDHMVRYAVSISWPQIKALLERDRGLTEKLNSKDSYLHEGKASKYFSLINLDGII